jgi:hypothetical protein
MAIASGEKNAKSIGSWQELFVPKTTARVKRLRENAIRTPEVSLERVRTEMKIGDKYDKEPRILQRAYFYQTYLKDKTVFIADVISTARSAVRPSRVPPPAGWKRKWTTR